MAFGSVLMKNSLRQPLKPRPMSERLKRFKPSALQFAAGVVSAAVMAGAVYGVVGDPGGYGEPVVRVAIAPVDDMVTASSEPVKGETAGKPATGAGATTPTGAPTPGDPQAAAIAADKAEAEAVARKVAAIAARTRRKALRAAPVRAVSERTRVGLLPRISKRGTRPFDVYARPVSRALLASDRPKIAIVLTGMGLNRELTLRAIAELPGEVTLAFAPYGGRLQRLINRARAAGHEVLLQVPMEPFGYPAVNPGKHTLLTRNGGDRTLADVRWHLSRFAGYAGVTNYLGGRFTSDAEALAPVFNELKRRGLVFLDDGASQRSIVLELSQVVGMPAARADALIDDSGGAASVRRSLDGVEEKARRKGFAVAVGVGLGGTIEALRQWIDGLDERGVKLVPATFAFRNRRG